MSQKAACNFYRAAWNADVV